jgi:predicted GH43/DUF377 family glycosyl hydrolase
MSVVLKYNELLKFNKNINKNIIFESIKILSKINKNVTNNCIFYKNFSFDTIIKKKIFNSSSSSIIKHPFLKDKFILNIRLVNYYLKSDGNSVNNYKKTITYNYIFILDKFFNIEKIKILNTFYDLTCQYIGIEDIRLFNFNNEIYFIGSAYNKNTGKISVVSNKYNLNSDKYNHMFITPSFKTINNWEKNWVFFNNNNELNVIYKWKPIYICKINYNTQKLDLIKENNNVPEIFNKFRGSTNGVEYDNKIWFVTHIQNKLFETKKYYTHVFVCFNKNMELLGYSNEFNFENNIVEFCIGLMINNNNFVITYSTLDKTTKMCVLSSDYVNGLIVN